MPLLNQWLSAVMLAGTLGGCASFPASDTTRPEGDGRALLAASAQAHGWSSYQHLRDISVSYAGEWNSLVARLQPALVDSRFRGTSEERLLIAERAIGQRHRGEGGTKQVARTIEGSTVWYNGLREPDPERRTAASLVADGYRLFLLGPIYLMERDARVEHAGTERIDGREHERLFARLRPGLGHAGEERVMLWIDAETRLTRRLWISADALPSTQGVIAEIDLFDYRASGGVNWPTRFIERLKRPFPLPVHQWRVVGLDLDRGFTIEDITGSDFAGAAARPATPIGPALNPAAEVPVQSHQGAKG